MTNGFMILINNHSMIIQKIRIHKFRMMINNFSLILKKLIKKKKKQIKKKKKFRQFTKIKMQILAVLHLNKVCKSKMLSNQKICKSQN